MSTEPESFLARWSRRKRTSDRAKEQPAENVAPQTPAALPVKEAEAAAQPGPASVTPSSRDPAAAPEVPLPPIESLDGLRSDYQPFFQQPVANDVRNAALKKLFADPHFNQMDMLDVYVDDYTQFEPLPAAMKLRLASARDFLLDSERAKLEAVEASSGAAAEPAPAATGGERSDTASADDGSAKPATDGAGAESGDALAAAPDATHPNAALERETPADAAALPVLPVRAAARGPSSN